MHRIREQIKLIELVPGDKIEQQCVREWFPNAKIIYDALPFSVDTLWCIGRQSQATKISFDSCFFFLK